MRLEIESNDRAAGSNREKLCQRNLGKLSAGPNVDFATCQHIFRNTTELNMDSFSMLGNVFAGGDKRGIDLTKVLVKFDTRNKS